MTIMMMMIDLAELMIDKRRLALFPAGTFTVILQIYQNLFCRFISKSPTHPKQDLNLR